MLHLTRYNAVELTFEARTLVFSSGVQALTSGLTKTRLEFKNITALVLRQGAKYVSLFYTATKTTTALSQIVYHMFSISLAPRCLSTLLALLR